MLRRAFALVLFGHFAALFVAGLPRSRFKDAAEALSRGYLELSGQAQDWGMYSVPDRHRTEYELLAELPGGRRERPWGSAQAMDARRLYLIEGLFLRNDGRALARRFLDVLHARSAEPSRPSRLILRRTSRRLRSFQALAGDGAALEPEPRATEIARSY